MDRKLHFSMDLKDYRNKRGHCWAFCCHHLLFPAFAMPFYAEREGLSEQMGVDVDDIFAVSAKILFFVPVLRELVLTLGGRIASLAVVEKLKVFGLVPGGVHEMISQQPGVDRIFLRTGFLRMALRKKLDLVPCYMFDECSAYKPLKVPDWVTAVQLWLNRTFGVGICLWKGRWGVPFNLIPNKGRYVHGFGRILKFDEVRGMSEDEAVQFWLEKFVEEEKRLFLELQKVEKRRLDVTLEITILKTRFQRSGGGKKHS
ncbi:hypothetical protein ScalyP_jg10685 [Parmales sp. scaly parma]|nr:hypothetical protein ScalyP_jg10685 [Parmales sp. scaly parma]